MNIIFHQFAGIGDCLFVTPALHVIKQAYPNSSITFHTNKSRLLKGNPWIDKIGNERKGVRATYTAPNSGKHPTKHHIIEVWERICDAYNLQTDTPKLKPELYLDNMPAKRNIVGVQIRHKRIYHSKRVWPKLEELSKQDGFEPIPLVKTDQDFVRQIASYRIVVCPEGGVSHIAAALGMPAIVLMGGFTCPEWVGYDFHTNITSNIDCKYCYNNNPCKNNFKCWDEVSINQIKELVL